jgi:hypothetical protein
MSDPHQMTAAAHLSIAELLVLEAAEPSAETGHKFALAAAHLDCARTITVLAEAERNRQSRLDMKSQMAGVQELASRLFPNEELLGTTTRA